MECGGSGGSGSSQLRGFIRAGHDVYPLPTSLPSLGLQRTEDYE